MNIREARVVSEMLKTKFNILQTPEHLKTLSRRGQLSKVTRGDKKIEDAIREILI
jgi:hypothetical protein